MQNRREKILNTFSSLVERYGINKTTMHDIAKEAGISVGTIYNDFANKQDLIDAFWQRVENHCIRHLDELIAQKLPLEQLLRLIIIEHIKIFNDQIRRNRGVYEMMTNGMITYIRRKIIDNRNIIKQELTKRVGLIISDGIKNGDFEAVDDIFGTAICFVEAFTEYWAPPLVLSRKQEDVIKDAESMFDFVIKALRK
ncbi:TetR/AcrR family transcriptional regulator [Pelosinus baikalensis]|uniref:TetR/AcrR family transcriptional regulator n=1 Tax=Pelosinus baikalensis TaxID=2892015 RepID=A0ABS8HZS7_9FIRM|nr:TetR/AcrR family transcriptional regulator [Pelosinus baikalensis]MCC5468682.1 TetR/AcrR family transcriptional regulator [Pelosinus baikalensis]